MPHPLTENGISHGKIMALSINCSLVGMWKKKQRDNSVFFRSEFLRFVLFYQYFLNHCHVMGMAGYGYWFCLAVLSMGSILYTIVSSWSIKICYYMGFQSWEDASHWSVCVMHTIDACTPPLPQLCSGSAKTPQQPAPLQFFGLAWEHIVISPTRENIIHQQVRLATVQKRLVGIFCVSTE